MKKFMKEDYLNKMIISYVGNKFLFYYDQHSKRRVCIGVVAYGVRLDY
jgi:hypothetical protein